MTDTTYHKIETLYVRDEKTHKLIEPLIFKSPVYGTLKQWDWTEKIDGTIIRVIWNQAENNLSFGGKTDNTSIPADLVKWLYENVSKEKMAVIFSDVDAVIYGEGYGAGIQKGGGYRPDKSFIVFDVLVGGKWWLDWPNTCDVAKKLGLDNVPYFDRMSLEDASSIVRLGFRSIVPSATCEAEGLVGRPIEPLFDKRGHRLIVKLKTKDFVR